MQKFKIAEQFECQEYRKSEASDKIGDDDIVE